MEKENALVPVNETDAPEIIVKSFDEIVQSVVNQAQFMILRGRTPRSVIKTRPGKGGKIFSYVPHGYVTTVLNRAFGFDWDFETVPYGNGDHFKQMPAGEGKRKMSILVMGRLTVRIRDPQDPTVVVAEITKTATGEKEDVPGMSWGSMVKSAESDALKKAASKLGVALDLYWQDADDDYIPPSEEMIALREAKERVPELFNVGLNPKQVQAEIKASFDIDVPVATLHKWRKESGQ